MLQLIESNISQYSQSNAAQRPFSCTVGKIVEVSALLKLGWKHVPMFDGRERKGSVCKPNRFQIKWACYDVPCTKHVRVLNCLSDKRDQFEDFTLGHCALGKCVQLSPGDTDNQVLQSATEPHGNIIVTPAHFEYRKHTSVTRFLHLAGQFPPIGHF